LAAKWNRYVIGLDEAGKSQVERTHSTMVKETPDTFYRVEVWSTGEMPVDNRIDHDRAEDSKTREPKPNGVSCRMLEIYPDQADPEAQRRAIEQLHRDTGQKNMPTAADYARHPSMHRTDSCDVICCVSGELYVMTDTDEVLMRPGDTVVIRGANHAWSNRSDKPALLAVTMIDAIPLP